MQLLGENFLHEFFVKRSEAGADFERFKMNSVLSIPQIDFMSDPSKTYANFLFSSFPLIPGRVILGASFADPVRRSLPFRRSFSAARRPSPLGRGPTGRTPHC